MSARRLTPPGLKGFFGGATRLESEWKLVKLKQFFPLGWGKIKLFWPQLEPPGPSPQLVWGVLGPKNFFEIHNPREAAVFGRRISRKKLFFQVVGKKGFFLKRALGGNGLGDVGVGRKPPPLKFGVGGGKRFFGGKKEVQKFKKP